MSSALNPGGSESGEGTHGVMILIGQIGYFIPKKDLRWFKLPASVAAKARTEIGGRPELARQLHNNEAVTLGVELRLEGPILRFSSIEEHHITPSRIFC